MAKQQPNSNAEVGLRRHSEAVSWVRKMHAPEDRNTAGNDCAQARTKCGPRSWSVAFYLRLLAYKMALLTCPCAFLVHSRINGLLWRSW